PDLAGRVWFVRADMCCIPSAGAFDLAINMFTSFGYFDQDRQNFEVLRALAASLKTGGRFFIDYLNRPQVIATLVPEDSFSRGGLKVRQNRSISADGLRVVKSVRVQGPQGIQQWVESVRMYSRVEMEEMLERAGFEVEQVYGGYLGLEHSESSERLIFSGRKKP
ncbi:MAG: class I SAM-dependent methyltransferase, partial [Candidatus Glassbacteria bacterium]